MLENIKKEIDIKVKPILNNKRLQIILTIICLFIIIYFTATARTGNIEFLKDQTTGKWIPLDLDSYYFLRISETLEKNNGILPPIDEMRYYTLNIGWTPELLPKVVYYLYKILILFDSNTTVAYANIWYPVIFFIGSLIIFFFLIYIITKSKILALFGVLLLSVIPPYVYHTLLGSSDHESLGIFSFLLMITIFLLAIKYLDKENRKKSVLFGYILLFSLSASFVIACWSGIAIFMFMIIPMTYLFIWIVNTQDIYDKKNYDIFLFYIISYPLIFILLPIWGNFSIFDELIRYSLQSQGLLGPFVYVLLIIDMSFILLYRFYNKTSSNKISDKNQKFRLIYSLLIVILLGFIFLNFVLDKNIIDVIVNVMERMLNPFGRARIGLTVSENQQPFFSTWLTNFTKTFFWISFLGIIMLGLKISLGIYKDNKKKEKEDRIYFIILWIFLVSAILFTRYSPTGIFNGESSVSVITFFIAFALFFGFTIGLYTNSKYKIDNYLLLIASWLIIILIAGRGAARLFIIISPLFVLLIIFAIKELLYYLKKVNEDISKVLLWCLIILIISLLLFNSFIMYNSVVIQAKSIGPAANYQWQNAMSWVRINTDENDKFVSWWDYSYHIQYLGERATLTDGGHASGYYDWLTGRYMLTGIRPDLALSFMKTVESNYLLIDPTDIGKYTAFSTIGSDASGKDRQSWIPTMTQNPAWTLETSNQTMYIFQGGTYLDQDINYEENGSNFLLPAYRAAIGGMRIIVDKNNNLIQQPYGIFIYNNKQKELPIRYLYFDNVLYDYDVGIPAVARIVTSGNQNSIGGLDLDKFGALIYISPKVAQTLFANIYLMRDPMNLYPSISIAHIESDYIVSSIRSQGGIIDDFFYFRGLRAPLKIYKLDYPDNIMIRRDYFIPELNINEDIVLANETLLKEIDNLNVVR